MIIESSQMFNNTSNAFHLKIADSGYAFCTPEWSASILTPPYSRLYYITKGTATITTINAIRPKL